MLIRKLTDWISSSVCSDFGISKVGSTETSSHDLPWVSLLCVVGKAHLQTWSLSIPIASPAIHLRRNLKTAIQ